MWRAGGEGKGGVWTLAKMLKFEARRKLQRQEARVKVLRAAAGGGLQFRFPFLGQGGPINLYRARPLAKQDGDRPEVFSFSIGYAF